MPWGLLPRLTDLSASYAFDPANVWSGLWPVLVGAALMFGLVRRSSRPNLNIPEGDLIVPLERLFHGSQRRMQQLAGNRTIRMATLRRPEVCATILARSEQKFAQWPLAGVLFLLLGLAIAGLAVRSENPRAITGSGGNPAAGFLQNRLGHERVKRLQSSARSRGFNACKVAHADKIDTHDCN